MNKNFPVSDRKPGGDEGGRFWAFSKVPGESDWVEEVRFHSHRDICCHAFLLDFIGHDVLVVDSNDWSAALFRE